MSMTKAVSLLLTIVLLVAATATRAAAQEKLTNAALLKNGGTITHEKLGPDAGNDAKSSPEASADGNMRSRHVIWGAPHAFHIELVQKMPVKEVNFVCTNYNNEISPKDIVIILPDGTEIQHQLEVLRPKGRDVPRQTVAIGKEIDRLTVKILSNHQGAPKPDGKFVNWGGIGEIEVMTTADMQKIMDVQQYNADMPSYIEGGRVRSDYADVKVTMPEVIPMGTYPGIFLTKAEFDALHEKIKNSKDEQTQQMYKAILGAAEEWKDKKVEFPDPNVPAQLKDRNDAPAQAHDNLSKTAGRIAYAYILTGNEAYAAKVREILVGYAKLYPNDYKEHKGVNGSDTSKVMAQRLSEAMWLLPLIQAYDIIHDADCMTEADHKLIQEDLIRTAITFINSKRPAASEVAALDKSNPEWRTATPTKAGRGVGNWLLFYYAAFIHGGIVMQDQDWIDLGAHKLKQTLVNGIGEDGMWGEGAIGYHLFGRHAMTASLEALARKGIDVYSLDNFRPKNLWDSPLKYAYPDGTSPGINDSGRSPVASGWQSMSYDFAYLRYNDANYGGIVNTSPTQLFQSSAHYFPSVIYEKQPVKPLEGLGSVIFDSLGYAIMRGNDGGDQTFLLLKYGPHGGVHGHPDKLNLILFADGDELAGEPQGYRYEDRRHSEWTRPTVAHWTIGVDQKSQLPSTGRMVAYQDAGDIKVMRGQSAGSIPGVGLDRTVVQMPGYFLDVFHAWGQAKRTIDLPLGFRGNLDALQGKDDQLKPMSDSAPGYKHIRAFEVKQDGTWTGTWQREAVSAEEASENEDVRRAHPANKVTVMVLAEPGTSFFIGKTVDERDRVVVRRIGKETTFATVIDPYKATDAVKSAEAIKVDGPVGGYGVKISRADGGTDLVIVRYDTQEGGRPAEASKFDGGSTDALVTVVRLDKDGKVLRMGMVGGTEASYGQTKLTSAEPGIAWTK